MRMSFDLLIVSNKKVVWFYDTSTGVYPVNSNGLVNLSEVFKVMMSSSRFSFNV